MIFSKIVLVSGLWAPPGPRLGGHNYADFDTICEMHLFLEKIQKHETFKTCTVIWRLAASGAASWGRPEPSRARAEPEPSRAEPSRADPSRSELNRTEPNEPNRTEPSRPTDHPTVRPSVRPSRKLYIQTPDQPPLRPLCYFMLPNILCWLRFDAV